MKQGDFSESGNLDLYSKNQKPQFSTFFMAWEELEVQIEQHSKISKSLCELEKLGITA